MTKLQEIMHERFYSNLISLQRDLKNKIMVKDQTGWRALYTPREYRDVARY
jgi:hypothetical protein